MFDLEPLSPDAIALSPDAIAQSLKLVQSLPNPLLRWQSYLALLALEGFCLWLQQRSSPIRLNRKQARLIEPINNTPAAISQLYLNQFRVCILAISEDDDEIEVPASVFDRSIAHFYIVARVYEESQQVSFRYFLQYDSSKLPRPNSEPSYFIPVSQFESDFEHLLLYLSCLEPSAIALPSLVRNRIETTLHQYLIQPATQVSNWLDAQSDDLAWTLFPFDFSIGSALRSSQRIAVEGLERPDLFLRALKQIERQGTLIPEDARIAYQSIALGSHLFRLYAIVWRIQPISETPEWSLLTVLESESELPDRTQMSLYESGHLIASQISQSGDAYLVTQAIGLEHEQFTLSVTSAEDILTFPPFNFRS